MDGLSSEERNGFLDGVMGWEVEEEVNRMTTNRWMQCKNVLYDLLVCVCVGVCALLQAVSEPGRVLGRPNGVH